MPGMNTLIFLVALLPGLPLLAQEAPPDAGKAKEQAPAKKLPDPTAVSTIEPEALLNFESYPPQVQRLVREAMALFSADR
jgi:hypothetical protein